MLYRIYIFYFLERYINLFLLFFCFVIILQFCSIYYLNFNINIKKNLRNIIDIF